MLITQGLKEKEDDKKKPVKVLVTTPSFDSGAWFFTSAFVNRFRANLENSQVLAVGMGKVPRKPGFKAITIPYPSFNRWGHFTAINPFFALLWHFPQFIIGAIVSLFYKPDIVISNGFVSILPVVWEKLRGSKLVVLHQFHGSISSSSNFIRRVVRLLCGALDLIITNSYDTMNEVIPLCDFEKVVKAELFADEIFFKGDIAKPKSDAFTILYVGRLDDGKLCGLLLELVTRRLNDPALRFEFVGEGQFEGEIRKLENMGSNVKYHGYVASSAALRKLYETADVVWSYTDENYMSMPAVEALACGRPIIVPGISAATRNPINKDIVPEHVGLIIDPYEIETAESLILDLQARGISDDFRRSCRKYAEAKYSSKNLDEAVGALLSLLT